MFSDDKIIKINCLFAFINFFIKISESNIQRDQLREALIEFEQKIEILKKEKKNMMDSFSKNIAK